jgi:hypothetical protein
VIVCLDRAAIIGAFRSRKMESLESWLEKQEGVITCDLVRAEIRSGILGTSNQETCDRQESWYQDTFAVIPSRQMHRPLCEQAAILAGAARRTGHRAKVDDALVAAAAKAAGAIVATANVKHFEQLGVEAVNPLKAD